MRALQLFFILSTLLITGCASFTKGVVEAVLEQEKKEDQRACWVRGRPFEGVATGLQNQLNESSTLKILKVHGIGSHSPGYSQQLLEGLVKNLQLSLVDEVIKEIQLTNSLEQDVGILRTQRYLSKDREKVLEFFELTWDTIVENEKYNIYYDNSAEQSFRRTPVNHSFKSFVNSTVPDVLMYNGIYRSEIQSSVNQALCVMMNTPWGELPNSGKMSCKTQSESFWSKSDTNLAIISHSLGSRVSIDALQTAAELIVESDESSTLAKQIQNTNLTIYMLSNQLPLLQLGQPTPKVSQQINEICTSGLASEHEKLFNNLHIVSFSDPNDLFSYPLSQEFLNKYIDSRLCPSLTNIVINIAEVNKLLGQEFANPLEAHLGYDKDQRVLDLITNGIGTKNTSELVTERCDFIEAIH